MGKVLIVGGGIAGMCCAITLARLDYEVRLIDIDPQWRALGAGLTIAGPAFRAFRSIGVLEELREHGFLSSTTTLLTPDGTVIASNPMPHLEPGLPTIGGILRPTLHNILAARVRAAGTEVRLGVTLTSLSERDEQVRVTLSDGSVDDYEFVIGADSINSKVRSLIFPEAGAPRFTGQGCWRMVVPRPPDQQGPVVYMGGRHGMGFNPISSTQMYMYLNSPEPDNRRVAPADQLRELRVLMEGYGGIAAKVREQMDESYLVNYRPLEAFFLERTWCRGRTLLIGDAAHATTPHLGFGAGLAVEDAVVLAEELGRNAPPTAFESFCARRLDRARYVVETAVRIGDLEIQGNWHDKPALLAAAGQRLAQPC